MAQKAFPREVPETLDFLYLYGLLYIDMKSLPFIHIAVLTAFMLNSFGPICPIARSADGEFRLPVPGVMVRLSPPLDPPILKGIKSTSR